MSGSALYVGKVLHRRWKPKRHRLEYRVFSLLLDIDDLPSLARRLKLFSHNRFNLFAFVDRDFGPGDGTMLRPWVEAQLAAAGLESKGIRISLLCYPRMMGYAFNPLSVFFCRRVCDGALIAILYEVHNTFGERHCYLSPADPAEPLVRQTCEKEFHVSPFIAMRATYQFHILPPADRAQTGDRLAIVIHESDSEGPLLDASFVAERATLSDAKLLSLLASHPLMTLKVIGCIHWEALKLWLKGVRLVDRPAPPSHPVTVIIQGRGAKNEHEQTFRPAA